MSMNCPNCRAPQPEGGSECAGCGVLFAKWKPPQERTAGAAGPSPAAASSAAPRWAAGTAVLALGVWFLFKPKPPVSPPGGGGVASAAAPAAAPDPSPPAEAAAPEVAAEPGSAWLARACEHTLGSVEPGKLAFKPDCAGNPAGTLESLRYNHYKSAYLVPAVEVSRLEVRPRVGSYTHGPDGRLDIEVELILRNASGDMVSSEGAIELSGAPAYLIETRPRNKELLRGHFGLTNYTAAGHILKATLYDACRLRKPQGPGESFTVDVVFNGTLQASGRLELDPYLPKPGP